jgi:hypothetical protein
MNSEQQIERIKLSEEIAHRQANINKMGAILALAKDTVREAQQRIDYEQKRLHQATERIGELDDNR